MTRGDLERRVAALEAAVERRSDGSDADDGGPRGISRRAVLKGLGVIGLAGYGAGSASADPQGQLGTESDPVRTVFTQRLAGGLTDEDPITSLVGTGLSVDDETLYTSVADAANTGEGERLYAGRDGSTLQFRSLVEGQNVSLSTDDGEVTIEADSSSSGESNTASNLGNGTGVFAGKSGTDLQFKSLVEGTNVSLSAGTDEVTIDASGAGEANTASNVGTGAGVFAQKAGTDLEFKSLVAGSNVSITSGTDALTVDATATYPSASDDGSTVLSNPTDLDFGTNLAVADDGDGTVTVDASTSGEANTASNLGTGTGLFAQKNGVDLEFNSLVGGTNVNLSASGGDVTIDVPSTSSAWEDGDGDTLLEPVSGSGYTGIDLSGISGAQVVTPWVGTTGETAFEAFVNGTRAGQFGTQGTDSANLTGAGNVLLGQYAQAVDTPVGGAVGGGGASGQENTVYDNYGTVAGGRNNQAGANDSDPTGAPFATVGGGNDNAASAESSTVAGGSINQANGQYSTVAGGSSNTTGGNRATVGGGQNNTASGTGATVPGGVSNAADGLYSFAAGRRSNATSAGVFVWADSQDADFASNSDYNGSGVTGSDTFHVRAQNGVRFVNSSGTTYISSSSTGWNTASTKAAKTNFQSVDTREVLDDVQSLDVTTWEYKGDDGDGTGVEHLGPMAEDFDEAFELGDSDRHINSINADGVALAAIKGAAERLEELERDLSKAKDENEVLEERLDAREERVRDLETELESRDERIDALEDRLEDVERAIDGCE